MPPSSSAKLPESPAGPPHRQRRGAWAAPLLALALVAAACGFAFWRYGAPGPLPAARAVVIPAGTTLEVARALADAGVIQAPRLFALAALATVREGPLHAAELRFPAHASFATVLAVLRTAPPVEHRVTIPEGLTAQQIEALLDRAPALKGPADLPEEGWVLPATYNYLYGTTRASIIARAHAALLRTLATLWDGRDAHLPFATKDDALILASIVERETAIPAERPRIAAVFLNRLKLGMRLQADPTVIYAVSDGAGVLKRPLRPADLAIASPYNTYRVAGLPPGPIDAPGIAAITAVLHPAPSAALYFVADGLGGHAFARTLSGQEHNIAIWQQRVHDEAQH
ncbi:MAG TPA: endolytic transglycosylase MltG [Acetobacteraceae bacterium]|nr:endolytic transglycosylase MltG [Acetobacteraceae bacterium]